MEVNLENRQKKIPLKTNQIKTLVRKILELKGVRHSSLSILFVSSQKMRALNHKYLKRNYVTDVLAFGVEGPKGARAFVSSQDKLLDLSGDIIIAPEKALQNSIEFDTSINHELTLYIIHGILHLLGYLDKKPSDIIKIRKEETRILKVLGNRKLVDDL